MAKEVSWTLGMYMLAIIVGVLLIVWLFAPSGSFPQLRGIVSGIKDSVSVGAPELTAENPAVSEVHQKELSALQSTIRSMIESPAENCFESYDGFTKLGEEGMKLEIKYDSREDKTYFDVWGGIGGKQKVTDSSFTVDHVRSCVIAGDETITSNFDQRFLSETDKTVPVEYKIADLVIAEDDGGIFRFTRNRIDYGSSFQDFEGHQWLFKPDSGHICFFPTVRSATIWSCEGGEAGGLAAFCFDSDETNGIPSKVRSGNLVRC